MRLRDRIQSIMKSQEEFQIIFLDLTGKIDFFVHHFFSIMADLLLQINTGNREVKKINILHSGRVLF